ncbi:tetratricopeptide repeat protein [Streptomyces sp. NPDC003860]
MTTGPAAPSPAWEARSAALWAAFDDHEPAAFRALVQGLVDELPRGHPLIAFELACANDSTGRPDRAAPLYRTALAGGLDPYRERRAHIQLASTLRNLGELAESIALLRAERAKDPAGLDDATRGLGGAVDAVLALALTDAGREREAVALAVGALARHLPRYNRSMAGYAAALVAPEPGPH